MKLALSTIEIRVVRFLGENYPVTVEDIRKGLSLRRETLLRVLKAVVAKGIVELEPLPDKTYVRLLVPGILSEGSAALARQPPEGDEGGDDSYMYI